MTEEVDDIDVLSQMPAGSSMDSAWLPLARLGNQKQSALAEQIGMDAGDFSKLVRSLPRVKALFKQLGVKVVDENARCVRNETFVELTRLAGRALQHRPELVWDEE